MTALETTERAERPGWAFATRPRWLASHLFAASVIALFVVAMFWQLDRREQRIEQNELIAARASATAVTIRSALGEGPLDALDYRRIEDSGTWLRPEVVRVANRSQNGVAGEWIVGLFETDGGQRVLVNRGFVPLGQSGETPPDRETITGWLRTSIERSGLGAEDTGEGDLVPRLNVEDITGRLDDPTVAPVWLQLEGPTGPDVPDPVPLPEQNNGPHLSYAIQWLTFAVLGTVVYALLLRRIAQGRHRTATAPPLDGPG